MYPLVKQQHVYARRHFVLFLLCQMAELLVLSKLKQKLVVLLILIREVTMSPKTRHPKVESKLLKSTSKAFPDIRVTIQGKAILIVRISHLLLVCQRCSLFTKRSALKMI